MNAKGIYKPINVGCVGPIYGPSTALITIYGNVSSTSKCKDKEKQTIKPPENH